MKRSDVVALFVEPDGVYPSLLEDWYDASRDAFSYEGSTAAVCHPPCDGWGAYATMPLRLRAGKGAGDYGEFKFSLDTVRRVGGLIEHPARSKAFQAFGLGIPRRSISLSDDGIGYIAEFDQGMYGHRCPKPTWIYFVVSSVDRVKIDFRRSFAVERIQRTQYGKRQYTPVLAASLFIEIASMAA